MVELAEVDQVLRQWQAAIMWVAEEIDGGRIDPGEFRRVIVAELNRRVEALAVVEGGEGVVEVSARRLEPGTPVDEEGPGGA